MAIPLSRLAAPFSQAWTLKDTKRLCDLQRRIPSPSEQGFADWREEAEAAMAGLYRAVAGHVLHVAERQGLPLPPHSTYVQAQALDIWRKAVAHEPLTGEDRRQLGESFHPILNLTLMKARSFEGRTPPIDEAIHGQLVHLMEEGTFDIGDINRLECGYSGQSLSIEMTGWTPRLLAFNDSTRHYEPMTADTITAPRVEHVTIEVPSGHLLVSDWFSHAGFANRSKEVLQGIPSINYEPGTVETTLRMASFMNVATVFVGDGSTDVLLDQNGLRVGRANEAVPPIGGQHMGSVSMGRWWVTLVDRQVLVDLLSQTMTDEQAEGEVAHLISDHPNGVLEIHVPPGTYHLYFSGSPETFEKHFDMAEVTMEGFDDPMFVLSPCELTPRPAPNPHQQIRKP